MTTREPYAQVKFRRENELTTDQHAAHKVAVAVMQAAEERTTHQGRRHVEITKRLTSNTIFALFTAKPT
jgi:hypothetical protein